MAENYQRARDAVLQASDLSPFLAEWRALNEKVREFDLWLEAEWQRLAAPIQPTVFMRDFLTTLLKEKIPDFEQREEEENSTPSSSSDERTRETAWKTTK